MHRRFRYVFCQLARIRHCPPEDIPCALNDLPDTLDETYARTLEDIGDLSWKRAHRLFQCVSVAARPLHVEELVDILAFDFEGESTPASLAKRRSEDPIHTVLSTCSSLLDVVNVDGSPVVQFVHFSVKEYLTSERLVKAKDIISRFHIFMAPAHTIMAQACLGVLLHLDESVTNDCLEDFPLAKYAAKYLVDHARFEYVSSKVQDGMKHLFDPRKSHFSVWVRIYDPEHPQSLSQLPERPSAATATPLHYAAFCGLHDVSTFLIVECSQDVNAQAFDKRETPLHVALRRRHMDIAQLLLKHGADPDARFYGKYTLLHQASNEGDVELAQFLLKHGADKDAQNERGQSPLILASRMRCMEIVRDLLKHGADMEARDMGGWTPLIHASTIGDTEIARLLLKQGANVKEQYRCRYTPLHYASSRGRLAVTQLLLEHGADVNARNAHNQTPLHEAKGKEVTRLLIEHGADANALDTQNRTPLHQASEDGITEVAGVLLERGVDANARDADKVTPLGLAASGPWYREEVHLHLVRLLLRYGSDIHARDDKGQTPFMRAKANGLRDIMQLLLEHGAEDHRI